MKKTFQFSFVLLAMMLLASCSGGGSDSGLSDNSAGTETVFVRMNARSNSDIASLSVEVRGSKATDDKPSALEYPSSICVQPSEYRVFRDINVSNDPISFCVLPDNDYVFHVKVFDVDHNLIYVYEGKKDITAGKPVSIPDKDEKWTDFSPANIKATAGDGKVFVSWDKVTGAVSYKLYWNKTGNVTKSSDEFISILGTSYSHDDLENDIPYYGAVTAVDSEGNESRESAEVPATPSACAEGTDKDGDGYCSPADCDDENPDVNPGAKEICDDVNDNDCDGQSDSADPGCQCSSETEVCIMASAKGKGAITPSGMVSVYKENSQTFVITPDADVKVKDVQVDGQSVGQVTTYTFENVTANHSIVAIFEAEHTITASSGAGGSISPTGNVKVDEGTDTTFTMKADDGYEVKEVEVDGLPVGKKTSYTFENVAADHSIHVVFEAGVVEKKYTITAIAGDNGNIVPEGQIEINAGESFEFTMIPDAGFEVADVSVDGVSVGAVTSYLFKNVLADHTIVVSFKEVKVPYYNITATSEGNGTIKPSGTLHEVYNVYKGDSLDFVMTPDADHKVKDVQVDGISVGQRTTYTFENVTADHSIHVVFEAEVVEKEYTITAVAGANGTIDHYGEVKINAGDSFNFTMFPESGFEVEDVSVDDKSVGAADSYLFENVQADHTIAVSFKAVEVPYYSITTSSEGNGRISPSGMVSVYKGDRQTFVMTPDADSKVKDVQVDGVSVGQITTYTFENVTADHRIHVVFEAGVVEKKYTITASSGPNGSISPNGDVEVYEGTDATFTMKADDGYDVAEVEVDGLPVGKKTSYTFENVMSNHTVRVTFVKIVKGYHTITATAGDNGSINPSGAVEVEDGKSQTFTMNADASYQVSDVEVDGVSVGAKTTYTFADVKTDHTIAVTFNDLPAVSRFQGVYSGSYYYIDGALRGTINQLTIDSTGTVAEGNVFYFAEEVSFSLSGSVDATGAVSFSGTKPSSELDPERTIKIKGTIASGKIEGSWTLTEDSELVDEGYFSAEKTNP